MTEAVQKALALWGLEGASVHLVAARENRVYRVSTDSRTVALRLHRRDHRTDAELWSELAWMHAVSEGGLRVPTPVRATGGELLHVVDGIQIDVLSWLSGTPVGKTGTPLPEGDQPGLFRAIGRDMARLHDISDRWMPPDGFVRCRWDREGLLGQDPLWGRFWENPSLSGEDLDLFKAVRERADRMLGQAEDDLDFGLIHADLVRENVLVDDGLLYLIDFDDGGFGFRLFDLATTLLKNRSEPDYPALRDALICGYREVRAIDTGLLDLFVLLRSLTYVGWVIPRMSEEGSKERNERFVRDARDLARRFLE
ncbi:homoserine kinase [Sulfitobacter sp. HNIBRBA3233]|uniref:phosphotransferase enzyme family protein n=1 Tax=Sulfitobacter marinivivus TaxID=3158558 RepID=UPI0032DE9073